VLQSKAAGDAELAGRRWDSLVGYLQEHEMRLHPVFDVFRFIQIGQWKLALRSSLV
jgi:hypothetical protein